jgi:hypothetical protein
MYSRLKRWRAIWLDSVGGWRGEASSVCGKSDFYRGSGSGDRRTCIQWVTAMKSRAEARGAQWRQLDGGEIYPIDRWLGGYGKLSHNPSANGSDAKIFTGLCLSDGHGARITASNRSTATGHRRRAGGGIRIFFSLTLTIPWGSSVRWTWQPN